ncbi:cation:proton antiporter subunit C, partial [Hyphomonas sp.]
SAGGDRVADLVHTYSNPLPHVLMLTAIVVGVATLSVGLALIVRIREAYGTIEADEVREIDMQTAIAQEAEQEAAEKEALA